MRRKLTDSLPWADPKSTINPDVVARYMDRNRTNWYVIFYGPMWFWMEHHP